MNREGIFLNINGSFLNLRHIVSIHHEERGRFWQDEERFTMTVIATASNGQTWPVWSKSVIGSIDSILEEAQLVMLELTHMVHAASPQ